MSNDIIHKNIQTYLKKRKFTLLDYQNDVIEQFSKHKHGIIEAPTGRGKTMALFLAILNHYLNQEKDETSLKMIWITPMRALATDTFQQLESAIHQIAPELILMQRTSDSTSYQKQKVKEKEWNILVTTPESFSLLSTYNTMLPALKKVNLIVIDEWHSLYGTKRGILLELTMAWLKRYNDTVKRWALSATLSHIDLAKQYLINSDSVHHIKDPFKKAIQLDLCLPQHIDDTFFNQLGTHLIDNVIDEIKRAKSSLIFTNTRSQSEKWFQLLLESGAFKKSEIALHHSAIDATLRQSAEQGIKAGKIKCIVATSSLDLGVDIEPVELVLHVGSPKGFERLKQRAGRSGHSPFATSRLVLIPRHTFEVLESIAAQGHINDPVKDDIPINVIHIDILMQHIVSIGLSDTFTIQDIIENCQNTVSFSTIKQENIQWLLDFCCNKNSLLKAYPEHCKLIEKNGQYKTNSRPQLLKSHRMSIGTITSEDSLQIMMKNRKKLGSIEETFIRQLKKNDTFLFAGRLLALEKIQDNIAFVRLSKSKYPKFTRWIGGSMVLTSQLSDCLVQLLDSFNHDSTIPKAAHQVLTWQQQLSHVPKKTEFLIECTTIDKLQTLFLYPFSGRATHHTMALGISHYLAETYNTEIVSTVNDYGIMLQCMSPLPVTTLDWRSLFSKHLLDNCESGFNANEMMMQEFRHICLISGLLYKGMPGRFKSGSYMYASNKLLFDIFQRYEPDNLFLKQAKQHIYQHHIIPNSLKQFLDSIPQKKIVLQEMQRLSPFAFALYTEQLIAKMGAEK